MNREVIVTVPGNSLQNVSSKFNGQQDTLSITFIGDIEVDITDLDKYVQVKFPNCPVRYTYRDPSGGYLIVGDIVQVSTRYGTSFATVVDEGRGYWTGPVKDVEGYFSDFVAL